MTADHLLFITGELSGGRPDDRAATDLIAAVRSVARDCLITVRAAEPAPAADQLTTWSQHDISVVVGPLDPSSPPGAEWGTYSHVIVTGTGVRRRARSWVDATQPQATRVLFLPSLPFREVDVLAPVLPADELAGLGYARSCVEEATRADAAWADELWCMTATDRGFWAAVLPDLPARVIPLAIAPAHHVLPVQARQGVVISAMDGHDILGASEDGAVRALNEIVPALRWRVPDLVCTIVADWPTPMLEAAAVLAEAHIVPSAQLTDAVGRARLVLAAHRYGRRQDGVVAECLRAGTPLVGTNVSVGGLDLGEAVALVPADRTEDLTQVAWRLLVDDDHWQHAAEVMGCVRADRYAPERRAAAVREAVTALGIDTVPGSPPRPPSPTLSPPPRARKPAPASLRPNGSTEPGPAVDDPPASERDRYQLWQERFGPTADVLDALRADVAALDDRPRVAVVLVVPELTVGPDDLHGAVSSVRDQIYQEWELLVAHTGSTRPDIRAMIDELGRHPDITIVNPPPSRDLAASLNAALAATDAPYFLCLPPDVRLKPHALAQVARWLAADPTLDLVYADEEHHGDGRQTPGPIGVDLKPDWSPDLLLSRDYIGNVVVMRSAAVEAVGGFASPLGERFVLDLVLRLTDDGGRVGHVPEPLYATGPPEASNAETTRVVDDAVRRRGWAAQIEPVAETSGYRVRFRSSSSPRVAIIIPTRDRVDLLRRCIDSVVERSTYANYEIVIVDNQSTDGTTLGYMLGGPWRVVRYPHHFNYARLVNLAARLVDCDVLLFLNNDTEVISGGWIEAMLEHALRREVGAVGPRLYFADGRPQHEGIVVGAWQDWATNLDHGGFQHRGDMVRDTSAVTGACTMIRPSVYWEVGGADERLRVAYNDVDLCLRVRQAGYQIVYTPYASLYHEEGSSRRGWQHHEDGPLFAARWHPMERADPYYSPVLSDVDRFRIRV